LFLGFSLFRCDVILGGVITTFRHFGISGFRDFGISGFRDFVIPSFRDFVIPGFRDFVIPGFRYADKSYLMSMTGMLSLSL